MRRNKTYNDFPLFQHANGQWCRKIQGKLRYFGTDQHKAYAKYLRAYPYLQDGKTPPPETATLANLLDAFMGVKKLAMDSGEIAERTFAEYEAVCDLIAETMGKQTPLEALTFAEFHKLRERLSKKKNGNPASPITVKRLLTFARMPFYFANEELGQSIRYRKALRTPPARMIREARYAAGQRMFSAEAIRKVVKAAGPELRAMILLGINCGFGPRDCAKLTIETLDLDGEWHNFPRPKTAVMRRCPLWPGTVKALRTVVGERESGTVFPHTWNRHVIARAFQAVCLGCDVYQEGITTFYSLRRTFETVACASGVPQAVINFIMGHAEHDMPAQYRQKVYDEKLRECTDYVRSWVIGEITLN